MFGPGDVRVVERSEPRLLDPTDAIIRVSASCICGSDLWPYRGVEAYDWPAPMGHEYVGIVEEVGEEVRTIEPGQFVVGSFWASDNTCEICRAGYQSACINRVPMGALGAQAELLRVPLADGTLVATPTVPADDLVPSLLAASDVLGTGWFAAVAAEAGPGKTVAVVGDGAVGLMGCWPRSSWARSASSFPAAMPIVRRWPASSARPTSSPSAATSSSRRSRSSRTASARTASSRPSAPRRHPRRHASRCAQAG